MHTNGQFTICDMTSAWQYDRAIKKKKKRSYFQSFVDFLIRSNRHDKPNDSNNKIGIGVFSI